MHRLFSRRYTSILQAARAFWQQQHLQTQKSNYQPNLESLDERITPDVTGSFADGVLTLDNAGDDEILDLTVNNGQIVINSTVNDLIDGDGAGGFTIDGVDPQQATVNQADVKTIILNTDAPNFLDINQADFGGATALRNVNYTGATQADDSVDFSANTNEDIYIRINVTGSGDQGVGDDYILPGSGISILQFQDIDTASVADLNIPQDGKIALDFSRLTETSGSVNIDISSPRAVLGGYNNLSLTLSDENSTNFIDVLVGGPGDDLLSGNDNDNLIIGMDGNDQLFGRGGNDQLNSNRDYSPDVDGTPNGAGPASLDEPYDELDDMTLFSDTQTNFDSQENVSAATKNAFSNFGMYGFGLGTGDFAADIEFANGLEPTATQDLLDGGDGDDVMYGFNNSSVSALGGAGNDFFTTNTQGRNNVIDMGEGDDSVAYSAGDTAIGGPGNDIITPADPSENLSGVSTFLFGEEGDDTLFGTFGREEIRPGPGNNSMGGNLTGDTVVSEGGNDDFGGSDTSQIVFQEPGEAGDGGQALSGLTPPGGQEVELAPGEVVEG